MDHRSAHWEATFSNTSRYYAHIFNVALGEYIAAHFDRQEAEPKSPPPPPLNLMHFWKASLAGKDRRED